MDDLIQWIVALSKRILHNKVAEWIIGGVIGVLLFNILINVLSNLITDRLSMIWDFIGNHADFFKAFGAGICSIIIVIVILLIFYSRTRRKKQGKTQKKAFSVKRLLPVLVVSLLVVSLLANVFWHLQSPPPPPGKVASPLCDRDCVIDASTINHRLKEEARDLQKQGKDKDACEHWYWASQEDPSDGEAKIGYQNYHMSHQSDPCSSPATVSFYINLAVVVQMIPGNDILNSSSRAMLQAMAQRQQELNDTHSSGPMLHLSLFNVENVTSQIDAAQQVIAATKSQNAIVGVVVLSSGTETLINELNNNQIPMVSVASLDNAKPLPYLRSVAPSFQAQADTAIHVMKNKTPQSSGPLRVVAFYRSGDTYDTDIENFLQQEAQNKNVQVFPRSYIAADINTQLVGYVKQFSDLSLVYMAGSPDDVSQFRAALNNENMHVPLLSPDTMYQWVYQLHTGDQIQNFRSLQFTAFAYHDLSAIHDDGGTQCASVEGSKQQHYDVFDMASDYKTDFASGGVYFGGSYTHDVASSDTLLAYDAVSLLDAAARIGVEETKKIPTTQIVLTKLQKFTPANPFPGVSGQISYQENQSVPYKKAVLLITINVLGGNSITPIQGTSATVWGGCYLFRTS